DRAGARANADSARRSSIPAEKRPAVDRPRTTCRPGYTPGGGPMRALVLLLSFPACGGHSTEDDSYDRREDSSTPPDDSGTDDSATDDSATNDDSTPPDDTGTALYGLDKRPENTTCLAPARPASEFDAEWEAVFTDLSFDYA